MFGGQGLGDRSYGRFRGCGSKLWGRERRVKGCEPRLKGLKLTAEDLDGGFR